MLLYFHGDYLHRPSVSHKPAGGLPAAALRGPALLPAPEAAAVFSGGAAGGRVRGGGVSSGAFLSGRAGLETGLNALHYGRSKLDFEKIMDRLYYLLYGNEAQYGTNH